MMNNVGDVPCYAMTGASGIQVGVYEKTMKALAESVEKEYGYEKKRHCAGRSPGNERMKKTPEPDTGEIMIGGVPYDEGDVPHYMTHG